LASGLAIRTSWKTDPGEGIPMKAELRLPLLPMNRHQVDWYYFPGSLVTGNWELVADASRLTADAWVFGLFDM
jgi:hypothetical protein